MKYDNSEYVRTMTDAVPDSIRKIEDLLLAGEFSAPYIKGILDKVRDTFSPVELDDYDKVKSTAIQWIRQSIRIADKKMVRYALKGYSPTTEDEKSPSVIAVVGTNGVGKTTTLVKLASNLLMHARESGKHDPRIQFITIDSVRTGAFEQIERFAKIFNADALKVETAEELQKAYNDRQDKTDALFIDTSGYNPDDTENIGKMHSILQEKGFEADIYLCVAASTLCSCLESTMDGYAPLKYESVIVTKMDEASHYGNIISACAQKQKSIAYLASGMNIAHGLHAATAEELTAFM